MLNNEKSVPRNIGFGIHTKGNFSYMLATETFQICTLTNMAAIFPNGGRKKCEQSIMFDDLSIFLPVIFISYTP